MSEECLFWFGKLSVFYGVTVLASCCFNESSQLIKQNQAIKETKDCVEMHEVHLKEKGFSLLMVLTTAALPSTVLDKYTQTTKHTQTKDWVEPLAAAGVV